MNKFYVAEDKDWIPFEPSRFVVMEHLGGGTVMICRGSEKNCKDIVCAMQFLYVTAVEELKDVEDVVTACWSDGTPSRIEQHRG